MIMNNYAYGSGSFGEWIKDEYGLPVYRYTLDQTKDKRGLTPCNPLWRNPSDHFHQVGNDRVLALASNYGYVQLRQDEGAPKLLNDFYPPDGQYGGGIGYLVDIDGYLSTYYDGNNPNFERNFGIGYYRKRVSNQKYQIDQVIFAPYGDEPLLISQVKITNNNPSEVNLRWIEYWGCQHHQLSYRAFMQAYFFGIAMKQSIGKTASRRRDFAKRFKSYFSTQLEGRALLNKQVFTGRSVTDKILWGLMQILMATIFRKLTGGAVSMPDEQCEFDDLAPPALFLVALDQLPNAFTCDPGSFFGSGQIAEPEHILRPLNNVLAPNHGQGAMLLEQQFSLKSGESKNCFYAFGYLPKNRSLKEIVDDYSGKKEKLFEQSMSQWKEDGISFSIPDKDWVAREVTWHNYYLHSNLTYDSYFDEHSQQQNGIYQYAFGFNAALRDLCQFTLPHTLLLPSMAKQLIRSILKQMHSDGSFPYGICGYGMIVPAPFIPSDLHLWMLWAVSEYILGTKDWDFLQEELPFYPLHGSPENSQSVIDRLILGYRYLVNTIGFGPHGLLRLLNGDWNDNIVVGYVPDKFHSQVIKRAESIFNASMAVYVLEKFVEVLNFAGMPHLVEEVKNNIKAQKQAVQKQWNERWFKRAWLSDSYGWVGEDHLWLEPQPWTIIGKIADLTQRHSLLKAIDRLLREPSPIGAMLLDKPLKGIFNKDGVFANGGVWAAINGLLIWAMAKEQQEGAWDEWKKNSLACHADVYPDIWYGIWSGPDCYNSILSSFPGHTMFNEELISKEKTSPEDKRESGNHLDLNMTDFPVMNMNCHAWPLYSLAKLVGIEFSPNGISITPVLKQSQFEFVSPLVGVRKDLDGYHGWYAPIGGEVQTVSLQLPEDESFSTLYINGKQQDMPGNGTGTIIFQGATAQGKLSWDVLF